MKSWSALEKQIESFTDDIRDIPVAQQVDPNEIQDFLVKHFPFNEPIDLTSLTEQIGGLMKNWTLHVTHPRYFGLFNPSVRLSGIIADAMVALYNPQLAAWSHAPLANEIEQYTLGVFKEALGYDIDATHANFTSGGAEANLSAVLASLSHRFPQVSTLGIAGIEGRPLVYLTGETHHSFVKIARQAGLGTDSIVKIQTDSDYRFDVNQLRERIRCDKEKGLLPLMIVGTAGTTAGGIVDPLSDLADMANQFGTWFHVDAAWGGSAVLSPKLKVLLKGIDRADSITWDAHKWLSVPMGAGMFFCKHREAIHNAFSISTSYMPERTGGTTIEPYTTTVQWSRRMIGFKVFMALAELGKEGLVSQIEGQATVGNALRDRLRNAGWKIRNKTELPVVCFTRDEIIGGEMSTQDILAEIYSRGKVWISDVLLGGEEQLLRACITSFRTNENDLDCLVSELDRALRTLRAKGNA